MRNDERLRTIYEVMAPYIVRNEHNWRDYLAFASQFHKHSFDNILLVYAQDEDVSILATRKQWAAIGRNLIPHAKGVAVCVYRNAKLTLDYLFDVSQTTGKEIHPTDWQLSDEMKKALTERLSYAHGFPKQDFSQALYAMASESVAENYNHFLQELKQETKGHLFTEIPAGGFEAQYIQLLTDSISYFIGKKCHLSDEEIQLSDGMATVSHFNNSRFICLDTHDLQNASDNVKRTQYLNLLSWCWEEMSRDRNERCLLVCDEAYLMIDPQVPQSLVFLRNVEKRARKYEAGLAIISHSVVDFLAPEVKMYGQALLDIPCYKILMGCDGKNLQETKDLYNLTDAEQELLESKRRGHALFIIGSKRLHVNFEIPAYKFSYMGKAGGR